MHTIIVAVRIAGLLLIMGTLSYSQNKEIDSLKQVISDQKDTTKIHTLVELSYAYFLNELQLPDSGIEYATKALNLAKTLGFKKGMARSYFSLGRAYQSKGQFRLSLRNYFESLRLSEQINDERAIASNYFYIGQIHYELFKMSTFPTGFEDALIYYRKAIVLFKKINFIEGELGTYTQLGFLYQSQFGRNLDSAEFYLKKALKGFQDLGNVGTVISMHLNLGNVYLNKRDFKNAENELLTVIKMANEINQPSILAFAYDNLGVVNFQNGEYEKAIEHYKKSIEQSRAHPDQFSNLSGAYNNLAGAYKEKKYFKKAIEASKLSLEASKNKGDSLTAYFGLSDEYFQSGDFKAAYEYYNKYVNFKDILAKENESSEIVRLQKDNEAFEREGKIALLEKEAEISNLALDKQKQTRIFFVLILILTLMIIGILINRYRLAKKTKKEQEIFFKELDNLKSRFFSNISHEFRTPLTLILAPLENRIASATESADKAELVLMQRSALRLLTLVNQLLDLSRLEAGSLKLKCIYADLQGAILSISSQFSSMADSKGIIFEVIAKQPVPLFFDQDKLEKIITNLLSNAFKFTSNGGTVTLTIDRHGPSKKFKFGTVEIGVRDTGMGIGAEHLPKIFKRFYQVDMSNTRAYEGAGIGLSLTKELVDLHHGTIEVRSEVGKGSVFTVHLPLGKDHLKSDEISPISDEDFQISDPIVPADEILILKERDPVLLHESILIIEDNSDLRSYMRNEFLHSYKILEAADGEEGMAIAIREVPTLIITDLMMPKKDGLSVCQELKEDERTSHIPIILLTAKADIDSKLQGYKKGADDYISKPFNLQELRIRIENLIRIRKNLQTKFAKPQTVLPSEIAIDSADGRFLKKAVEIVEAHLTDSSFGVEPLAEKMAVSQTQLYRKLQAVTGFGPNEFIRHIRLHRAADLLRNKAGNVSEVAYQVGINNLSYFAKVFKEKFGVTPMEFLKNTSNSDGLK